MNITETLAQELNLRPEYVENVISLLDEGNTIPFIARYRKEMHGSMDDQVIRQLSDRVTYLRGLEKRKEDVMHAISEQSKLTDALKKSIENADTLTAVEDLYLPFRPKRKTRASAARAKGLEPLATRLIVGTKQSVEALAQEFVSAEQEVNTWQDALSGAMDILAEDCSVNAALRGHLRALIRNTGELVSSGKEVEKTVYEKYGAFPAQFAASRAIRCSRSTAANAKSCSRWKSSVTTNQHCS